MRTILLCMAFICFSAASRGQAPKPAGTTLRHVVLFTFKAGSTQEEVAGVVRSFNSLHGRVPQVKQMEWGRNISPEGLDQGFTHCFVLTFASEKDLAEYQAHPAHKEFQTVLKPHMDRVFVVDYFVAPR